ncbi:MAG: hypothetical protein J6M02_06335 [Clostridia bacterium]|nr:hypothetical protein [Clostridia bacterium]
MNKVGILPKFVNAFFDYLNSFKKSYWMVEPQYGFFYINKRGDEIRLDKFPHSNVTEVSVRNSFGFYTNFDYYKVVALNDGDIVEVIIHWGNITSRMGILERTVMVAHRFFRYQKNGGFVEIFPDKVK